VGALEENGQGLRGACCILQDGLWTHRLIHAQAQTHTHARTDTYAHNRHRHTHICPVPHSPGQLMGTQTHTRACTNKYAHTDTQACKGTGTHTYLPRAALSRMAFAINRPTKWNFFRCAEDEDRGLMYSWSCWAPTYVHERLKSCSCVFSCAGIFVCISCV